MFLFVGLRGAALLRYDVLGDFDGGLGAGKQQTGHGGGREGHG